MASRKEQKEKLRQERLAREQAAAAASARRKRMGYAFAGLLIGGVVIAVVAIAFASGGGGGGGGSWPSGSVPKRQETDLSAAAKEAGCTLTSPKNEGRGHTTKPVQYKSKPPTSGSHYPVPAHDAAYLTAPKPFESLVHALEHGRVIYWFKPNVAPRIKGDLHALYNEDKALVVLTPDTRPMPFPVAATA